MKNVFCLIFCVFALFGCKHKTRLLVPTIKGKLYSKFDNKPIQDVNIFGCKYFINYFDTIKTRKSGVFLIQGYSSVTNDPRLESRDISYIFLLKKEKQYKYINSKEYYNKNDYFHKDTIDLGIIYFEDLKSIDKDSIPK